MRNACAWRRNAAARNAVLGATEACGADESCFLEPLMEIPDAGETPAERKLAPFHGAWHGSVDPVFRDFAY